MCRPAASASARASALGPLVRWAGLFHRLRHEAAVLGEFPDRGGLGLVIGVVVGVIVTRRRGTRSPVDEPVQAILTARPAGA